MMQSNAVIAPQMEAHHPINPITLSFYVVIALFSFLEVPLNRKRWMKEEATQ